jgi:flagellar biosynthesis component FlhA
MAVPEMLSILSVSIVVGGNYIVGVVVFIMLMIIHFIVINNGSARCSR